MSNELIIQYAKHSIELYDEIYSISAPSRKTLIRWQKILEIGRKIEYLSKKYNKSANEIIDYFHEINADNLNECKAELLGIFSMDSIIEVKKNKEVLRDLLIVMTLIKNNQLPIMVMNTLKNNYISERMPAIREEILKIMSELKWELDTDRFYVIVDTETNSLPRGDMPSKGFPIQLAYIIMNSNKEVVAAKNNYIAPIFPIDPKAEAIHCISKSYLEYNGYSPKKVWKEFKNDMELLPNKVFVAHNSSFDLGVLDKLAWYVGEPMIDFNLVKCSLKYFRGRKDLPKKGNKLVDIQFAYGITDEEVKQKVKEYYGKSFGNPHNAMYDTALLSIILAKEDVDIIL